MTDRGAGQNDPRAACSTGGESTDERTATEVIREPGAHQIQTGGNRTPTMSETVRTWLVERTYTDRDLVVLTYATPDGEQSFTRELASSALGGTSVTAARDVEPDRLTPVEDDQDRERYAHEAERVRENNDPDAEI